MSQKISEVIGSEAREILFQAIANGSVDLGDDADTTAAIFGQLGGAFYGVDGIPSAWLAKLTMREFITAMADSLLALSEIAPDAH